MRWVCALVLLAPQAAPQDEYKDRLTKISRNSAAKHYQIGDYLTTAQMHQWAREQYYKTIEFEPDHEGARKRLGYKKGDSGWESDASIQQQFANKKKDAEAEKARKSFQERMDSAGRDLSRQWVDLAAWCKAQKLQAEAEGAYKKALEYDPAHAGARKELGFEKDAKGGAWLSKSERELRKEMRDGIGKAPQGAAASSESAVEKALSVKTKKREGGHFMVESPHLTDPQLTGLLQHAEHAYAMFHKIFGATDLFGDRKMVQLVLNTKAQHEAYVDAFHKGDAAHKELSKKSQGSSGFPLCEQVQENRPLPSVEDMVVHTTAQILSNMYSGGGNHWLHEGTSYHFTRLMKGTAMTYCVDLAGTGPKSDGKNYQDPEHWPVVCKVWVRDGKDPEINAILKCDNLAELSGAETVKAWSIVDFLITDHKEKLVGLCAKLKAETPVEEAFRSVFNWSLGDLDTRWKAYVKVSY